MHMHCIYIHILYICTIYIVCVCLYMYVCIPWVSVCVCMASFEDISRWGGKCVHTRIHVGGGWGALAGGYVGEILLYENEVCVCVSASVCACVCTGVGFCMCVDWMYSGVWIEQSQGLVLVCLSVHICTYPVIDMSDAQARQRILNKELCQRKRLEDDV